MNIEDLRKDIVNFFTDISPESYHIDDAAYMLGISNSNDMKNYFKIIDDLVSEHILNTKDSTYYKLNISKEESNITITGIYKQYRDSFGFVVNTSIGDILIYTENNNFAFNNDEVEVEIIKNGYRNRKPEGKITKIIKRHNTKIIGTYQKERHFAFVIPDDDRFIKDIYIVTDPSINARNGAKVLVEIIKWPNHKQNCPTGKIIEVIGYKDTPGVDVSCIVAKNDIPFKFKEETLKEVEKLNFEVVYDTKRLDLRQLCTITIDGEDAKDLDDAISLEILPNKNYRLGVHIADVSHYVKSQGAIDREAFERGTSVYLVDRVIPMLPVQLSNGICSLNPHTDRYAISCIMDINADGQVLNSHITPSIINVNRRCNYTEVYKALIDEIIPSDILEYMPLLKNLYELSKSLTNMRLKRGALDFDIPEFKVVINSEGTPLRIIERNRTIAEKIIEECMLIANETVAEFLAKRGVSIYRVHEKPKEEKLQALQKVMHYVGKTIAINEENISNSKIYQEFLTSVSGTEIEDIANMLLLRSMQQAKYTVENIGHFGLASKCYTHFTSPIRRYPDLMIHRLIKKAINWESGYSKRDSEEKFLTIAAAESSRLEQRAVVTEREVNDLKKAEYMLPFIGHSFNGKISNITNFGMFVQLNNGIEGLIAINNIDDDYYIFDEEHYILIGRHTNRTFKLGDEITVTVLHVDVERAMIDFVLGEVNPATLIYKHRFKSKDHPLFTKLPAKHSQANNTYKNKSKNTKKAKKGGKYGKKTGTKFNNR